MNEELIDFCTWLCKKGYLNQVGTNYDYGEEAYVTTTELEPEEVLEEYEKEKKDGNII